MCQNRVLLVPLVLNVHTPPHVCYFRQNSSSKQILPWIAADPVSGCCRFTASHSFMWSPFYTRYGRQYAKTITSGGECMAWSGIEEE